MSETHEIVFHNVSYELSTERRDHLIDRGIIRRDLVNGGYQFVPHRPLDLPDYEALLSLSEDWELGQKDQRPRFSCGFVFWRSSVVLVWKTHPLWQRDRMNGVGGQAQPGETPQECMEREWQEETSLPGLNLFEQFLTLEDDHVIVHMHRGRYPNDFDLEGRLPEKNDVGERLVLKNLSLREWADPRQAIDNLCWLIPMASRDAFHLGGRVQARVRA